jgi:hypothetical protein
MTDQQHPITPPRELVRQWIKECDQPDDPRWQEYEQDIANHAAEWGYDQRDKVDEAKLQKARDEELEACCEWLCTEYRYGVDLALKLRAARRPKPPSLKEQALELARPAGTEGAYVTFGPEELALIRRALEALPND